MKKKILALVLTMSLLLTSVCIGVSAVDVGDEEKGISDIKTTAAEELSERGAGLEWDIKTTDNEAFSLQKYATWTNSERTEAMISISVIPNIQLQEIEFPVDVVFVADISDSMAGDRLAQEKAGIKATAQDIINRNNGSRVALVSFASGAWTNCNFTTNLTTFNSSVDALTVNGLTDYGAGFTQAKNLFDARTNTSNAPRVAFISDGLPTAGSLTAKSVKAAINGMGGKVFGLQYMLGNGIAKEFKEVVDTAYALDSVNGFAERLRALVVEYDEAAAPKNVVLTDTISSHFNISGVSDVTVSGGTVAVSGKIISWNIGTATTMLSLNANITFAHSDDQLGNFVTNNGNAVLSYAGGSLGVESPVLPRNKYCVTYSVTSGRGTAPVDSRMYWPGETVTVLGLVEDNATDDVIFRYWRYGGKLQAGDTFNIGRADANIVGIFAPIPNVELEAVATNPLVADWLPLYNGSSDTGLDYKVEEGVLNIRTRPDAGYRTFDSSAATALNALHTAGTIDLSQLKTMRFSGDWYGIRLYLLRTNNIDYVEQLDLSQVNFSTTSTHSGLFCGYATSGYNTSNKSVSKSTTFQGLRYLKRVTLPATDSSTYVKRDNYYNYRETMFADCTSLEYVDMSQFRTSLWNCDFMNCSSLQTVLLNQNYSRQTSIPDACFYNCSSLASISLPSVITWVKDSSFENCSALSQITIPNCNRLGSRAFMGCTSLQSATVSSVSLQLDNSVFKDCTSLLSFNDAGAQITNTGYLYSVFSGCTSLISARIPSTSTVIGYDCLFNDCTSLQSVDIPPSVLYLSNAFRNCASLTNVTIPSTVTGLSYGLFFGCTSLTSITIPATVTSLTYASGVASVDGMFENCTNLSNVTILMGQSDSNPFSVGQEMFKNCTSLKYIQLPPVTTTIAKEGFCRSALEYIDLSMISNTVGQNAFEYCYYLRTVIAPNIGSSAFTDYFHFLYTPVMLNENIYSAGATIGGAIYGDSTIEYWCTHHNNNYTNGELDYNYGGLASAAPAYTPSAGAARASKLSLHDVAVKKTENTKVVSTLEMGRGDAQTITYGQVEEGATIDYTIKVIGPRAPDLLGDFLHGVVTVRDKLPEGLTLDTDSITVSQYAVIAGNYDPAHPENSTRAPGQVVKQNNQDYSIDTDGTIVVKIVGLESMGMMIITFSCTVDDLPSGVLHRDFYNTATVQEQNVVKTSNVTYHYVDKNTTQSNTKRVTYKYTGNVPSGAVVPNAEEHAPDTSVTVAEYTAVSGYRFEGWTFYEEDGTEFTSITQAPSGGARGAGAGDTFTMPDENLLAIGTYSSNTIPTPTEVVVSYEFTGSVPASKVGTEPTPSTITYNTTTTIAAEPAAVSGYYFQGWTIDGTAYAAGATTPALTKDTVVRGNWVQLATGTDTDTSSSGSDTPSSVSEPLYYTLTIQYRNAPSGDSRFNTRTEVHQAGESITLPTVTNIPSNYIFDDYISDDVYVKDGGFDMPAKNTVVTGIFVNASKATPDNYIRYYDGTTLLQVTQLAAGTTTHTLTSAPITNPEVGVTVEGGIPTKAGYLFAGWYTTAQAPGTTSGTMFPQSITIDTYKDANGDLNLYAGWVAKGTVSVDNSDPNKNSYGAQSLSGFDLEGIQIKSKDIPDAGAEAEAWQNAEYDGLRFITVYRNGMLNELEGLYTATSENPNYVAASDTDVKYGYTLYAKSDLGTISELRADLLDGAVDVDCTRNGEMNHKYFTNYRLSTVVIKYEGADQQYVNTPIEARAYVDYIDANGFARRGYDTYGDTEGESTFAGGCRASFEQARTALSRPAAV